MNLTGFKSMRIHSSDHTVTSWMREKEVFNICDCGYFEGLNKILSSNKKNAQLFKFTNTQQPIYSNRYYISITL